MSMTVGDMLRQMDMTRARFWWGRYGCLVTLYTPTVAMATVGVALVVFAGGGG